jgi:hypothetical protein
MYQGSDDTKHYFIARVMDDWAFVRINRTDLDLKDIRPYPAPKKQFYYYTVNPTNGFNKITEK